MSHLSKKLDRILNIRDKDSIKSRISSDDEGRGNIITRKCIFLSFFFAKIILLVLYY